MSLENYINKQNIISSTRPIDAVQLRAEDRDVINHETVEITNFDDMLQVIIYLIIGNIFQLKIVLYNTIFTKTYQI